MMMNHLKVCETVLPVQCMKCSYLVYDEKHVDFIGDKYHLQCVPDFIVKILKTDGHLPVIVPTSVVYTNPEGYKYEPAISRWVENLD